MAFGAEKSCAAIHNAWHRAGGVFLLFVGWVGVSVAQQGPAPTPPPLPSPNCEVAAPPRRRTSSNFAIWGGKGGGVGVVGPGNAGPQHVGPGGSSGNSCLGRGVDMQCVEKAYVLTRSRTWVVAATTRRPNH